MKEQVLVIFKYERSFAIQSAQLQTETPLTNPTTLVELVRVSDSAGNARANNF